MAPENLDRLASPEEESELFRPKYWSEEIDFADPNLCCAASEELTRNKDDALKAISSESDLIFHTNSSAHTYPQLQTVSCN